MAAVRWSEKRFWLEYLLGLGLFWLNTSLASGLVASLAWVGVAVAVLEYVLAGVLLWKWKPYVGFGFATGCVAIVAFFVLFIVEMIIHPPDEE